MTEDDIDRLFGYSRSKSKGREQLGGVEVIQMNTYGEDRIRGRTEFTASPKAKPIKKDFANSCTFLRIDDAEDKLMSGMTNTQLT